MKIKFLSDKAQMPTRADKGAAGFDLYVPQDTVIHPGHNIVPLDFAIELTGESEAQIRPRSGFSAKGMEGYCIQDNSCNRYDADVILGTIDKTYRGNVGVIIKSYERIPFLIKRGTRIAQMVISHCYLGELSLVADLSDTDRGEGGFGHTGTR